MLSFEDLREASPESPRNAAALFPAKLSCSS